MVVYGGRAHFPLVHRATAALGLHAVLGRDVLGKKAMESWIVAEEGEAAVVAHCHCKTGVGERLPVVCVDDHVPDGPLALDVGDSPVEAHAVAQLSLVFGERHAGRPDKPAVTGKE